MTYFRFMMVFVMMGIGVILSAVVAVDDTLKYMRIEEAIATVEVSGSRRTLVERALKTSTYHRSLKVPTTLMFTDGSEIQTEHGFSEYDIRNLIDGGALSVFYNTDNGKISTERPTPWESWSVLLFFCFAFIVCFVIRLQFFPGGRPDTYH